MGVKGQVSVCAAPKVEFNVEVQGERDDDPVTTTLSHAVEEMLRGSLDMGELRIAKNRNWEVYIDAIVSSWN